MSYRFADFDLDPIRYQLTRNGEPVDAPRQIFELILLLIRHRDRPVTKEEILATIWHGRSVTEASLTHAIATARRLLGDSPKSQATIRTVHKRGYWWVAETVENYQEPLDARARPYVGRRDELQILIGALDQAHAGRSELVLMVGEAGVGKSTLAQRFADAVRRDGVTVISACAEDLSPTPPFYLWRQVLSELASSGLVDSSTESIFRGDLSNDGYSASETLRDSDLFLESVAAKLHLFEAIASALSRACHRGKVAIVLEDLHNADRASLEALQFLLSQASRAPTLIVGTQRPAIQTRSSSAGQLAKLARAPNVRSLVLGNLTRDEVREFLDCLADQNLPTSASDRLFAASAGNPFFLWQLVAIARAHRGADIEPGTRAIPSTVRTAISAHIDGLPPAAQDLLRIAAVTGQAFDLLVVSSVAEIPVASASSLIKLCVNGGILRPRTAYRFEFSHSLLRDALYDEIDPHERASLHFAIGNSLREIFGDSEGDHLPSMAVHFREAALIGGRDLAVATLRRCGELAAHALAFQDAAALFSDALSLARGVASPDRELECRLLLGGGSALLCAGDRAGAREKLAELAHLAESAGNGVLLAEAALSFAPSVLSLEVGVVDGLLIETLERSLALASLASSETRTELAGRLALALYWSEDDERREYAQSILREAATSASEGERARALLFRLGANWSPDNLEVRRQELDVLISNRARLPGPLAPVARVYRVASFLETNNLNEMDREISTLEGELRDARVPYCAWYPTMFRATQALYRGELEQALDLASQYVAIGQRFEDSNVANSFAAQWGEVQWLRGEVAAAIEPVEALARQFPALVEWSCVVALFHAAVGRGSEAESRIGEMCDSGFAGLTRRRSISSVISACVLAEAVDRLNLSEYADQLYEILLPFRGQNAVAGYGVLCWGSVSRFLGQVAALSGKEREAIVLFEEALASDSRAGCDSWIARSEIALARMLARREEGVSRSRSLAERAVRRAKSHGMHRLVAEAEAVLDLQSHR
jgi:DNA-binding winged helix-turn-helix (wHTH) protein/tetratricopeptide (TPR) repeat protein